MKETGRYLITTADEGTWKFDRPVLFLGEWCRLYERRHIWEQMDAIVAAPYGLGKAKKDADYAEARELENKLFPEFYQLLNQYHGLNHNARFWQILLGHWFRRAITVLLNRVRTLKQCLESYSISGTIFYSDKSYILSANDSYSALWAFNDDRWNQELNAEILRFLELQNLQIKTIHQDVLSHDLQPFRFSHPGLKHSVIQKIKSRSLNAFMAISAKFCRESDAFIVNGYLSKSAQLWLQASLRQWPQIWKSHQLVIDISHDHALRSSLSEAFIGKPSDSVENIARRLLFQLLPICYLEGFNSLHQAVSQLPWPKNPRFIFTSNSFDTDELFKLWAAEKVSLGSNYYVGQHGNNYGTYRYMFPSVEEETADKFLTWGWKEKGDNCEYVPTFILKKSKYKKQVCNPEGGLLLIEQPLNNRITTWDNTIEFQRYFQDQQLFVSRINAEARKNLTIRLHSLSRYLDWDEDARWADLDPALNIDSGHINIDKLIADSRLIVHSYDSTGILETLSADIPTLAFWRNGFDHLREGAIPYYQLLVDAKIIHFSSITVAQQVNEVWKDVESWWQQKDVQKARELFCMEYANLSNNLVDTLLPAFLGSQ